MLAFYHINSRKPLSKASVCTKYSFTVTLLSRSSEWKGHTRVKVKRKMANICKAEDILKIIINKTARGRLSLKAKVTTMSTLRSVTDRKVKHGVLQQSTLAKMQIIWQLRFVLCNQCVAETSE